MKILHTADWHIGHQLYGYDRTEEHIFFFDQLNNIILQEKPDALVVAGDVFDNAMPSIAAQQLYNKQLMRLRTTCPQAHIIVIAGNHDSKQRLELNRELWQTQNVTVVGTIERDGDEVNADKLITVIAPHGEPIGAIVAVPYCLPSNLPGADHEPEKRMAELFETLAAHARQLIGNQLPIAAVAHMAIGHSADIIGTADAYTPEIFGTNFDYIALGHIHNSNYMESEIWRYSGTPIAMSFKEQYDHSITIADITLNEKPKIKTHNIKQLIAVADLSNQPLTYEQVLKQAAEMPKNEPKYLRIKLKNDGIEHHDLEQRLLTIFDGTKVKLCTIELARNTESASNDASDNAMSISDFKQYEPIEIARKHFVEINGGEMPAEIEECFNKIMSELQASESE